MKACDLFHAGTALVAVRSDGQMAFAYGTLFLEKCEHGRPNAQSEVGKGSANVNSVNAVSRNEIVRVFDTNSFLILIPKSEHKSSPQPLMTLSSNLE
jgi:hypothetical protein